MPASHFDVNSMTGRPKFIVRHSTVAELKFRALFFCHFNKISVKHLLKLTQVAKNQFGFATAILWH
jgi:hypothetical protein